MKLRQVGTQQQRRASFCIVCPVYCIVSEWILIRKTLRNQCFCRKRLLKGLKFSILLIKQKKTTFIIKLENFYKSKLILISISV